MASDPQITTAPAFGQAAVAYFVYGLVYMAGAGHLGMSGASSRSAESGAWIWYLTGSLIVVLFPWLISRGYLWFTRALTLFLLFRVGGLVKVAAGPMASDPIPLPFGLAVSTGLGSLLFASVALVTAGFLARASFRRR